MQTEETQELPNIPELEADYELIRELGRGGTAVVYLGRERDLGRYVAIKVVHPAYLQDSDAAARIVREARTVSRLQHPNIVMLYGVKRLDQRGYALILQFVPGTTVKERLRRDGPFSLALTERVLTDLGSALQYAHQHRIVHRDIKPENVFLDDDTGAARLADFGIARFWDSDSRLTVPGTAIGTPTYMSPEQVDGRELDGRSDIYSVGLVGYEMLTGQSPWAGETLYGIIYKQKHEQLPPLAEVRAGIPEYFRNAIERALRKDPNERWRDAGEFLAALQNNPYARVLRAPKTLADATGLAGAGADGVGAAADGGPETADPAVTENAPTLLFRHDEPQPLRPETAPAGEATTRRPDSPPASVTPPATRSTPPPTMPMEEEEKHGDSPPPPWLTALEEGRITQFSAKRRRARGAPERDVTWDPGVPPTLLTRMQELGVVRMAAVLLVLSALVALAFLLVWLGRR